MRATKAYIASLGTTGLLLAFSASLLLLVGTLFAFDAWPGGGIRDAVESVLVDDDDGDTARVAGPEQVALDAAPAAVAVAGGPGTPGGGTGGLGDTVGQVSPDVGDTVSETGESLSDIVRDLPDVKVGGDGVTIGN